MVFGLKFLWARVRQLLAYEKQKARFASSTDEEARASPRVERTLAISGLDDPPTSKDGSKPTPVQLVIACPGPRAPESPASRLLPEGSGDAQPNQADVKRPGPVRADEELDRSEEVAQTTNGTWKYDSQGPSSRTPAFDTHISYFPTPRVDKPRAEGSSSDPQRHSSEDVVHSTDADNGATRQVFKRQYLRFEDLSPTARRLARMRAIGNTCFHPPPPSPSEGLSTSPQPSGGLACRDDAVTTHHSMDTSEDDRSPEEEQIAVQRYWEGPIVFTVDDDCDFSDDDEDDVYPIFPDPADVQEDDFSDDSFDDAETGYSGGNGDTEEAESSWARTLEN